MKSYLKSYRQSPRKTRLVANLIKGKSASRAFVELKFLKKRAAHAFGKLLNSALSNAKENNSLDKEKLFIKEVRVDEGPTLKRMRPRARGSAHLIRKRTSNITLVLDETSENSKFIKPAKSAKPAKSKNKKLEDKANRQELKI